MCPLEEILEATLPSLQDGSEPGLDRCSCTPRRVAPKDPARCKGMPSQLLQLSHGPFFLRLRRAAQAEGLCRAPKDHMNLL